MFIYDITINDFNTELNWNGGIIAHIEHSQLQFMHEAIWNNYSSCQSEKDVRFVLQPHLPVSEGLKRPTSNLHVLFFTTQLFTRLHIHHKMMSEKEAVMSNTESLVSACQIHCLVRAD